MRRATRPHRPSAAHLAVLAGTAATLVVALAGPAAAAGDTAPARGTPIGEVLAATAVGGLAIVAVVVLGVLHRRRGLLDPLTRLVEEKAGRPAWAAIPTAVTGLSLLIAVFGYYWDVSWHIDRGRDAGAFANPAHWFIIVGLDGIAFAGLLAVLLGDRRSPHAVRIRGDWYAPVGGVLLALCGVVALAGFPLDDIWHRLFGQDVTAWGPTHIQMIGGASLATLAVWALDLEGARAVSGDGGRADPVWLTKAFDVVSGGAFLIGLCTLQVEFDFGVPQFQQLYHPILIALAAGIGLVAVRIRAGRGAALGAVAFYLVARGGLTLLVGPLLGRSLQHFPLFVVSAVVVEVVAHLVPREKQLTAGVLSGLGIGTVGLAAEWGWSRLWMPLPWGASLLPEALVLVPLAAVAAGIVGAFVGRALLPRDVPRQATPRGLAVAAWLAILVCLAAPLRPQAHDGWKATLITAPVPGRDGDPGRHVSLTVRLRPADAAVGAHWFDALAWQGRKQGDGGLAVIKMERVGPGTYRAAVPVPIGGTWKTLLRLHVGSSMQAVPIALPADPAIPAKAVPVERQVTRSFTGEKAILQREATGGSIGLQRLAYAVLAGIAAAWLLAMAWGLRRFDPGSRSGGTRPRPAPEGRAAAHA